MERATRQISPIEKMTVFFTTFEAIAELIFIGLIGFWIMSRKVMAEPILKALTNLTVNVTLPCLVISQMLREFQPQTHPYWWALPLWWAGFSLALFIYTIIFVQFTKPRFPAEIRLTSFFQNGIFVPLALITKLFGVDSPLLVDLFLFTLFFPALLFNVYGLFFQKKSFHLKVLLTNPVMLATLGALVLRLAHWNHIVPSFALDGLGQIGLMTTPLLMLIIGGNLYLDLKQTTTIYWKETISFLIIRNILFPLLMAGFLMLTKLPANLALLLFFQSVVPPITAAPVVTGLAKGNRSIVTQLLIASFALTLVTIPLFYMLYTRLSLI